MKLPAAILIAAFAAAGPARADRLSLRFFGPLAPLRPGSGQALPPAASGYHQDLGESGGLIPRGAHSEAPVEWGLTSLSFISGLGVSLAFNIYFKSLAQEWVDGGTHPLDAKVGTGFFRVLVNAPLVALAVWGINQLSEAHSIAYGWPYLAGLICDVILWGAQLGLTKAGGVEPPKVAGGAAGSKTGEVLDVAFLIIGALAVPLAEVLMAQRIREDRSSDYGGVIIGLTEPEELKPAAAQAGFAATTTLYRTQF